MSAFTFTAPIVTPEDEVAERAALSDEERKRIHDDVFGSRDDDDDAAGSSVPPHGASVIMDDDSSVMRQALEQLRIAMRRLPAADTVDYREALRIAPQVVRRESPPAHFLRFHGMDAVRAAAGLAKYWSVRRMLFGPERCHERMTLDGALRDDVETMRRGFVTEMHPDTHGRRVCYFDRVRVTKEVGHRDSFGRCFWYIAQTLTDDEGTRRRGCIWILNYRGYDLYKNFDRQLTRRFMMSLHCKHITVKALHVCKGPGLSVSDIVLPIIKQMMGRQIRLRTTLHSGSSSEAVYQSMAPYGFDRRHAGVFFDGLLGDTRIADVWLMERRRLEAEEAERERRSE